MRQILLVGVHSTDSELIIGALGSHARCTRADTREEYAARLRSGPYDQIFVDVQAMDLDCGDPESCRNFLRRAWQANPDIEIVVLGPQDGSRTLVNLVRAGASEFITTPLNSDVLKHVFDNLRAKRTIKGQIHYFSNMTLSAETRRFFRRCSPAMKDVLEKVRAVADTKALVLLLGETGVGKGWLARIIHSLSNRADGPFINVHCGSVPETLFESEIFGHERGAFTGADRQQIGRLELGAEGTVLLDEVGTMTPTQQVKLLHVLQEKSFHRVGGVGDIPLEARIIAATNSDLRARVEKGDFRKDLYFRLNAFPISIPPLRERLEEMELLVEHFLNIFRARHGRDVRGLHPFAMDAILLYDWPGNVRELENVLERAYLLEETETIRPESLPLELVCTDGKNHNGNVIDTTRPLSELKKMAVDSLERLYILKSFEENGGRVDKTARRAGMSTRHLRNLIHKHGIHRADYRRCST